MSKDSIEANATFAEQYKFSFPLLSDMTGEVCKAYGACPESNVLRNTYVIGTGGSILRIFEDVNPKDQAEIVLKFLHESSISTQPSGEQVAPQNFAFNNIINSPKGEQQKMDEQQNDDMDVDQVVKTVVADHQEVMTGQSVEPISAIGPSQIQPAQDGKRPPLVFALGTLATDFGTKARQDSIVQHMGKDDLLRYLDKNPSQAAALIWTLNLDAMPIYAIQPQGPFANEVYARLCEFLGEQINAGVERVSIPGVIVGQTQLLSGQIVPVIVPELRCMYSWTTAALVESVCGKPPLKSAKAEEQKTYAQKTKAVVNFLERIYHDLRNLGIDACDRAKNYAASNIANANNIFESALEKKLELHSIDVVPSPIGQDCCDVKLMFFDPENVLRAKTVYQFTVCSADVCPYMIGPIRSWSMP